MLALFTVTITVSACLLFLIQPMIAKMIMPHLGGAPTVWNTAMLFFQACLLAGYAYAHAGAKYLTIKRHITLHVVLLSLSLLTLPLTLYVPDIDAAHHPIRWMLVALALSVGFPFLMLSSSAPLLQHWFSHSGHRLASNPYPMYAASNAGSLTALFAFPLLVEPFLPTGQQTLGWSVLYACYLLLIGACMWRIYRGHQPQPQQVQGDDENLPLAVAARQWLYWIALAAVPSSLMLGVTSYISTDVASVPLLWIMPLALYLLTFIFAFGNTQDLYRGCQKIFLPTVLFVLVLTLSNSGFDVGVLVAHLFGFFVIAMMCHGRLNECKPHVSRLTQFYLCMAVGGVTGGLINGMAAPVLTNDVYEYPVMLIVAALLYPLYRERGLHRASLIWLNAFLVVLLTYYACHTWITELPLHDRLTGGKDMTRGLDWIIYLLIVLTGLLVLRRSRVSFVGAMLLIYGTQIFIERDDVLFRERNFFGVSRVAMLEDETTKGYYHGTTLHGIQSQKPEYKLRPVAYYSALKEVIENLPEAYRDDPFAVLGMGMGTVQCYAREAQHFDYFEIDPIVKAIATDPHHFTYLTDCPGVYSIYLGDGRIEIEAMPDTHYGLIILDAYSSDSLPVHLITREATALYRSKLKPGGVLAFNISNRHMNLQPILANIGHALGMQVYSKNFTSMTDLSYPSIWVMMSDSREALDAIAVAGGGWYELQPNDMRVWSDDYSNILQALTLTQGWFMRDRKDAQ